MNEHDRILFDDLMDKFLSDNIDTAQQARLFGMIRQPEFEALLDNYIRTGFDVAAGMEASPAWETAFDAKLLARIREMPGENSRGGLSIRRIRILSRYAAVLLILALAGTFYFLRKGGPVPGPVTVAAVHPEIGPGHDGALLTLSGGQHILLDSTGNGLLATQGNTKIRKEDGRIIYSGDGGKEMLYNSISTARGRQWSLVLPDGTRVRLNAASSLRYPAAFTGGERVVELSGEAYFEVAKNEAKPFIVKVNRAEVKVLGTRFDVMAYEDEPLQTTTLLEGAVTISHGANVRALSPGQQAQLDGQASIQVVDHMDVEAAMAWTTGFFKFDHTDIRAMMREISRWYDVDVVYETTMKSSDTYSGRVSRDLAITDMLTFLEGNKIHHFRIEGKKIIVLP